MDGAIKKAKIATVGTFDGLHRGHRKVIDTLKEIAFRDGLIPLVVCFDRHPLETIAPERAPGQIQSPSERTNLLFREGLQLLTIEFTPAVAATTARDWLTDLRDNHGVRKMVIGYDNTFGSDGVGMSIADYMQLGKELGVEIIEAPVVEGISSSKIRKLISEGKIEEANELLGHPFSLIGEVVHGRGVGKGLGFPTANISVGYKALLPSDGVYYATASLPDGKTLDAMVNVGKRPTMETGGERTIEAHLLDYDSDLYGNRIRLRFKKRLRDEKKFDSIRELKMQLKEDKKTIENLK